MSSTYSKIYIHIVFAVKNRNSLIQSAWEERLYRYITGIIQNKGHKMIRVNGIANHIHFLIGMNPSGCLSDLIREIKKLSNEFIKENKFTKYKFAWQEGYEAFSYSHSQLDDVIRYISNQKKHHRKKTFKEEYIQFLKKFKIDYQDKYLFEWIE